MTIHSVLASRHARGNASTSGIVKTTKAVARHSSSAELTRAAQAQLARPDDEEVERLQEKLARLIESFRAVIRDILFVVFELGQSFAASWRTQLNLSPSP
ncbi:MAG: hypothetical protein OXU45_00830 [Candidatus Melainabacteria bacterium]|nr:hypothetical protein [Candidatus Melainabacteria bacterium]